MSKIPQELSPDRAEVLRKYGIDMLILYDLTLLAHRLDSPQVSQEQRARFYAVIAPMLPGIMRIDKPAGLEDMLVFLNQDYNPPEIRESQTESQAKPDSAPAHHQSSQEVLSPISHLAKTAGCSTGCLYIHLKSHQIPGLTIRKDPTRDRKSYSFQDEAGRKQAEDYVLATIKARPRKAKGIPNTNPAPQANPPHIARPQQEILTMSVYQNPNIVIYTHSLAGYLGVEAFGFQKRVTRMFNEVGDHQQLTGAELQQIRKSSLFTDINSRLSSLDSVFGKLVSATALESRYGKERVAQALKSRGVGAVGHLLPDRVKVYDPKSAETIIAFLNQASQPC